MDTVLFTPFRGFSTLLTKKSGCPIQRFFRHGSHITDMGFYTSLEWSAGCLLPSPGSLEAVAVYRLSVIWILQSSGY